jgi:hypothetical protein
LSLLLKGLPAFAFLLMAVPLGAQFDLGAAFSGQPRIARGALQRAEEILPEGFVLYEGQKEYYTIAIPKDWIAYDQSKTLKEKGGEKAQRMEGSRFNLVNFYLPPSPASQGSMTEELIKKLSTGEVPSFFVQQMPAEKGMSCSGFSDKAEKWVREMVYWGKGATILEAPHSEPSPVAGCKGVRVGGSGQPAGGNAPWVVDMYAVSDGKTLYLFTLRNHADHFKKNAEVFQEAVSTARLAAAK